MGRLFKPLEDEGEVKTRQEINEQVKNEADEAERASGGRTGSILSTPGYISHRHFYVSESVSGLFEDVSMKEYSSYFTNEKAIALSSSTDSVYNVFGYFGCDAR